MVEEEELVKDLKMDGEPVTLKVPGTEGMADFIKIARDFSKAGPDAKDNDVMKHLSNEGIESMVNLVNITLKKSFPSKWENDKEKLEEWGMENNISLIMRIIEMCSPRDPEADRKAKILKRMQDDRERTPGDKK